MTAPSDQRGQNGRAEPGGKGPAGERAQADQGEVGWREGRGLRGVRRSIHVGAGRRVRVPGWKRGDSEDGGEAFGQGHIPKLMAHSFL